VVEAGRRAAALAALGLLVCSIVPSNVFAATGTPAGTAIVNSASAAYSDGSGNAFTSVSNTVSTTVQSAPSLSIVAGATQKTVPGGQLSSSFVATNTGNGVATLAFTVPSQTGTDGSATSIVAYTLDTVTTTLPTLPAGCTSTSTTAASCQTLAELDTLAASLPLAAGKSLDVGVVYNVPNTAAAGTLAAPQTVITTLGGTASQSAANNAGTSGTVTSAPLATPPSETDDVLADARLDLQKAGVNSGSASLSYTIYGANGGATAAHDLLSVKTLLGGASGVFVSDAIPQFGGVPLAVQSIALATNTTNGFAASTVTYYYSTSSTPTGWTALAASATPPATATFVGVLFSGGANGIELNPNNGATSTGRVSAANAAFTLTIVTAVPSGPNSGNTNAVVNQVDSVVGGGEANPTPDSAVTNPAPYVLGPAIPANTSDAANAGLVTAAGTGLAYPTQAAGSAATQQGASNAVGNAANASGSVFNGPSGNPTATGSYNAVAPVNASDDFSAIAYSPSGFVPTNTSPTGIVGNALGSTVTSSTYVTFVNTLQNQGNAADNITVNAVAPSGWTVAIYAAGATIASGTSLSGPAAATASATFANVPSGNASSTTNLLSYQVVYYPSSAATAFTTYDSVVTATSANSPSVSNATHDEIVIGGPLALTKTQTLDSTTCTGGVAVPGCIIKYSIAYTNNALPASACPATAPTTYPAYDGGYFVKGLTISENGKTGVNTWGGTYTTSTGVTANVTTGLNAPAADTTTGTTFTGNTAGSYAFAASIGGTGLILAPGCSGTITFAVTVSTS
jgi:hypothetical protein